MRHKRPPPTASHPRAVARILVPVMPVKPLQVSALSRPEEKPAAIAEPAPGMQTPGLVTVWGETTMPSRTVTPEVESPEKAAGQEAGAVSRAATGSQVATGSRGLTGSQGVAALGSAAHGLRTGSLDPRVLA